MEWRETIQYGKKCLISSDEKLKITNEGKKGGDWYCLWGQYEWTGPNGKHVAFCRLVRIGTLEECKRG